LTQHVDMAHQVGERDGFRSLVATCYRGWWTGSFWLAGWLCVCLVCSCRWRAGVVVCVPPTVCVAVSESSLLRVCGDTVDGPMNDTTCPMTHSWRITSGVRTFRLRTGTHINGVCLCARVALTRSQTAGHHHHGVCGDDVWTERPECRCVLGQDVW
jgi:hypothetical protein